MKKTFYLLFYFLTAIAGQPDDECRLCIRYDLPGIKVLLNKYKRTIIEGISICIISTTISEACNRLIKGLQRLFSKKISIQNFLTDNGIIAGTSQLFVYYKDLRFRYAHGMKSINL